MEPTRRAELLGHILPRTVVGLALWLLIFAIGAGTSGVVFFVAYERRVTGLETRIDDLRSEMNQKLSDAVTQLQNADKAIQGGGVTGTGTAGPAAEAVRLLTQVGPSVAQVESTDASGARISGSGFVLNSTANQTWVLTSYHLVAGAIFSAPAGQAPSVSVHVAGSDHAGTVYSWDAAHDFALVIVDAGSVPALAFSNEVPAPGVTVWAVAAASGQFGATAAKGQLTAATPQNLTSNAVYGPQATGGPLVDAEGRVMGVLTAASTGAQPATPGQAAPVRLACVQVVICPR